MKKRFGSLLVVLALGVVACGGDGTSPDPGVSVTEPAPEASQQVAVDPEAMAVAATIVDHLGPDVAFEAVVLALGAGYQVGQIADGAAVLESDGSILGVDPEDPPSDLLADGPNAFGESVIVLAAPADLALADDGVVFADILAAFDRDISSGAFLPDQAPDPASMDERHKVETVVAGILGLVDAGYSLDQIIEGLVLGEQRWSVATSDTQVCVVLAESDGTLIVPAREPSSRFTRSNYCNLRIQDGSLDAWIDGKLVQGVTTSTTTTTAATETSAGEADPGSFSFDAAYAGLDGDEFSWNWNGTFSIVDGELVGSGTMSGASDSACSIEDGPEHRVVFTVSGQFDIAGTAGDSTMLVVLVPTGGSLDLSVGDLSEFCVELSVDLGNAFLEVPLGNVEADLLPIEVPLGGGSTTLDFGEGFVIEVTVTAN